MATNAAYALLTNDQLDRQIAELKKRGARGTPVGQQDVQGGAEANPIEETGAPSVASSLVPSDYVSPEGRRGFTQGESPDAQASREINAEKNDIAKTAEINDTYWNRINAIKKAGLEEDKALEEAKTRDQRARETQGIEGKIRGIEGQPTYQMPQGQKEVVPGTGIYRMPTNGYGVRPDGTPKGPGFMGELKRPDGRVSTELSIGVTFDGKEMEIPALVPTLTQNEKDYLLGGGKPTDAIIKKAADHARQRMSEGKSPFEESRSFTNRGVTSVAKALTPGQDEEVKDLREQKKWTEAMQTGKLYEPKAEKLSDIDKFQMRQSLASISKVNSMIDAANNGKIPVETMIEQLEEASPGVTSSLGDPKNPKYAVAVRSYYSRALSQRRDAMMNEHQTMYGKGVTPNVAGGLTAQPKVTTAPGATEQGVPATNENVVVSTGIEKGTGRKVNRFKNGTVVYADAGPTPQRGRELSIGSPTRKPSLASQLPDFVGRAIETDISRAKSVAKTIEDALTGAGRKRKDWQER